MAERVDKWKSDDGHIYDTEVQALKADVAFWKKEYQKATQQAKAVGPSSSYGSSGGGGHD